MKDNIKAILMAGLLAAGFMLPWGGVPAAETGWELEDKQEDRSLYVRDVPGSDYDMFKGTLLVDAPMPVIAAILRDLPAYPEWMAYVGQGKVVKAFDPNNMIVYTLIDFPWPLADRDMVLQNQTTFDETTGEVRIVSGPVAELIIPVDANIIRIDKMVQNFILEFVSKDQTRVSYVLYLEPKGMLPAGLVNLSVKGVPYTSLEGLEKMTLKEKYQSADILDDCNREIAKKIAAFHLDKYIRDPSVIDRILADEALLRLVVDAGPSEAGARQLVARLREMYPDDEAIARCLR